MIKTTKEEKEELLEIVDLTFKNIKEGKETRCPKCNTKINIVSGLVLYDPREINCKCGYCNYREIQ